MKFKDMVVCLRKKKCLDRSIPRPSGFSETCMGGFVMGHGLLATSYHFGAIIRTLLGEILLGCSVKEVAVKVICLHIVGELTRSWSRPLSAKTLRTSGSGRLLCTPSLWMAHPVSPNWNAWYAECHSFSLPSSCPEVTLKVCLFIYCLHLIFFLK